MANTREAFERLLSSIPRYPSEDKFDPSFAMKLYTHLERRYNSELFNQDMLLKRLERVAHDQESYDAMYFKIKYIYKLVDELYDLKYS